MSTLTASVFILFFIFITATIVLISHIQRAVQQKYINFLNENSIALKKLSEINQRYIFYPCVNFDQTNTYDNEDFFEDISCSDYLIYQLQSISSDFSDQIIRVNRNAQKYQKYLRDVKSIQLGQFQCSIEKFKLNKLLKIEENLLNQNLQAPVTQFKITVTLYCSRMNGRIYNSKTQDFSVDEIFSFINRLKNKSGRFYNDRDIWNSLCRVERGKVSNKMRFSIYERDGYRCRYCGVSEQYATLEIDHIIPISKGGKSTYENLQTLCRKCNYEKGNKRYRY